mmetsp:Transcript_28131/g.82670  ORF Transcript_28131/g.82670 Transcript_28131/m.82670 type:complete len:344 (+) Transcript_28131:210-1241(+)
MMMNVLEDRTKTCVRRPRGLRVLVVMRADDVCGDVRCVREGLWRNKSQGRLVVAGALVVDEAGQRREDIHVSDRVEVGHVDEAGGVDAREEGVGELEVGKVLVLHRRRRHGRLRNLRLRRSGRGGCGLGAELGGSRLVAKLVAVLREPRQRARARPAGARKRAAARLHVRGEVLLDGEGLEVAAGAGKAALALEVPAEEVLLRLVFGREHLWARGALHRGVPALLVRALLAVRRHVEHEVGFALESLGADLARERALLGLGEEDGRHLSRHDVRRTALARPGHLVAHVVRKGRAPGGRRRAGEIEGRRCPSTRKARGRGLPGVQGGIGVGVRAGVQEHVHRCC